MTNNYFEKRIQEKLNQFEIEPSENLFNHIIEKRAAKSKSFLNFSYTKLAVAMFSVLVITTIVLINRSSAPVKVTNMAAISTENPQDEIDNLGKENVDKDSSSPSKGGQPNEVGVITQSPVKNGNLTKKVNSKSLLKADKSRKSVEKAISNTNKNKKQTVKAAIIPLNTKKGYADKKSKDNKENYSGFSDNGVLIAERYFNIDSKNRPLIASQAHQGKSHLYVYHSVDEQLLASKELDYLVLKPISRKTMGFDKEEVSIVNYKYERRVINPRKPVFVDVLYSSLYSRHTVNGNNSLNNNYKSLAQPNNNEQLSIRVSFPISSRINVFTGFGYMNLTTSFKGTIQNTENRVHYVSVTDYINDPVTGNQIPVQRIETVKNEDVNYNFKNTYKIMQVPLGLSYNIGLSKFDFALHGGALVNICINAKGQNADFNKELTSEFNSSRKHLGFGASLSFMAAYKLNNRFKLIAEPGLQYFKINSQKSGNIMNETILNNGLSLGLRYTLF